MRPLSPPSPEGRPARGAARTPRRIAHRSTRRTFAWALFGLLVVVTGCEENGLAPPVDPPQLAGRWSGSVNISNETFATTLVLSQDGSVVGGTAAISQLLPTSSVEGAIDRAGRLVMLVESGCETWFGTFSVSGNEQSMQGPIGVDRQACPTGIDEAGTLSVTRQ